MALNSTSTQPDEQPWQPQSLRDWIEVLHGAAKFKPDHPQYGQAQQVIQDALANIGELGQTATSEDVKAAGELAPGVAGNLLAGIVGFGRGASLGLVKPPSVPGVGDVIGQTHPVATAVGDVAGAGATMALAAPLTAGLSPMATGAVLGGSYGAARGAIDPALTGDRKIDAVLGGLTGLVGGAVTGKIAGKLAPAVAQVGRNVMRLFGARSAEAGKQIVGKELVDATEATLRRFLEAKGVPAEQIEQTIARSRPLWERGAPQPALAAQARPVPPPEPRLSGKVAPLAGTEGRGFQVTGERATPAIPASAPTIGEMSGVANLQVVPRAAAEVPAPAAGGAVTRSGRSVADILREGERVMGRPLSATEKDAVLQRLFGMRTSHPGHPLWFGPGAPTE